MRTGPAALALAIPFALVACGGGSEIPVKVTVEDVTQRQPTGGTGQTLSSFFPIKSGQITRTAWDLDALTLAHMRALAITWNPSAGATLENLLSQALTSRNVPQFSEFNFEALQDSNGILVQESPAYAYRATKTEAGKYAAIAYRAIFKHSTHIFQGGVYNIQDGRLSKGHFALSTGIEPTTGTGRISGIWKGKTVALEGGSEIAKPQSVSLTEAQAGIVEADVQIDTNLQEHVLIAGQSASITSSNWEDSSIDYSDVSLRSSDAHTRLEGITGRPELSSLDAARIDYISLTAAGVRAPDGCTKRRTYSSSV